MNKIIDKLIEDYLNRRHKYGREEAREHLRLSMEICWNEGEMEGSRKAFIKVAELLEK